MDTLDAKDPIDLEKETRARMRRVTDPDGYCIGEAENQIEGKYVEDVLVDV